MKVRSIDKYRNPDYPDQQIVLQNPYLLKTLPERWKHNAQISAALAATSALLLTACTTKTGGNTAATIPVPFFEHGIGRGGFGCVSVAPPAFLSESEAFSVIEEVASREGLHFSQNSSELKNVKIPKTSLNPTEDNLQLGYKKGTLTLDGFDADKNIAFEYVSQEDIEAWATGPANFTFTSYDFIDTAKALNESVNKVNTDFPTAVFYDPGYQYDDAIKKILDDTGHDYHESQEKIKEIVKEDLRKQVVDFIAWLKAQQII